MSDQAKSDQDMPDQDMSDRDPILRLAGVGKLFGDFVAIDDATMIVRSGTIHALVGENGAGKSTLMNLIYGLVPRDAGSIRLRGLEVDFASPAAAIAAGIGMVHQHFKLSPSYTVTQNVILGAEPMMSLGRVDVDKAEREVLALSKRYGIELDPQAVVGKLPVGLRQRVEILKALYRQAEILILDEPTAVLTPSETRELFATMRSLADHGRSVIFISHKLREVLAVSDDISVMRRGRVLRTFSNTGVTAQQIANEMVGRSVLLRVDKSPATPGLPVQLSVDRLVSFGDRGDLAVDTLSLAVRAGEIVGVAGVQGNGQDELVECIAGLRRPVSGGIAVAGQALGAGPQTAREAGVAYIPADRGGVGLSLRSSIWENMAVGHLRSLKRGPFLSTRAARVFAEGLIATFDIRGGGIDALAGSLSGGNQQKVQIARELARETRLVIAEQPSQGVDIGAIESIHKLLVDMRDAGRAVLVVSADLDEIMALSDRIVVMFRGRIVADLAAAATSYEEIGILMAGSRHHDSSAATGGDFAPAHAEAGHVG